MTIMSITTYHYFENAAHDFATIVTMTTNPKFVVSSELTYEAGEQKIEELHKTFNQPIETRHHDDFVVHDITVILP